MSEYTFQESLVRFLMKKEIREVVYSNDANLQAKLGLPPEHIIRLLQIDSDNVDFFVRTIEHKNLTHIIHQLPFTSKILGEDLHRFAHDYFPGSPIDGKNQFEYTLEFGNYLKSRISKRDLPFYAEDVLEYELNKIQLLVKTTKFPRDEEVTTSFEDILKKFPSDENLLDLVFVSSYHHQIFCLKCNVFDVLKQLDANEMPKSANSSDLYALIYLDYADTISSCILNSSTIKFIKACNGKNKLGEVAIKLLGIKNQTDSENLRKAKGECLELVKFLYRLGVVEVLRP